MVKKIKRWIRNQVQEVIEDWRKDWPWIIGIMVTVALLAFEFCEAIRK